MNGTPRYPGIRITTNGNQLVAYHTEARITDGGVFYPITPSTEMGENYQLSFAEGKLNVFGASEARRARRRASTRRRAGAIAFSVCGKRTVNFTSGQGIVYGAEQYYHAPGKFSTMILEVSARALTKHALNVHCGHDDIYAVHGHRLDHAVRQGLAAGGRPGADHPEGRRALAHARASTSRTASSPRTSSGRSSATRPS